MCHFPYTILGYVISRLTEGVQYKHLFVEFFGWYENESKIFFAMEYMEYGDLSRYIKDLRLVEAKEVTRQILEGLEVLHGQGICHRDLKPAVGLTDLVHRVSPLK